MPNITLTITPTAVNSIGAAWRVKSTTVQSEWKDSAETVVAAAGTYTIQFKYVEGYSTPAEQTLTVAAVDLTPTGVYGAVSWLATWNPPVSVCFFKGQVFACGTKVTAPASTARVVRWSEIGAFRFLGCTANSLRNEAGEYYIGESDSEMALRVIPLDSAVICYGAFSITSFTPVSQPAPAFNIRQVENIGIKNPLAVAGNATSQLFVDRLGYLRMLTLTKEGIQVKNLGYQDIFSAMQASMSFATGADVISVVYNQEEDEYYISNGTLSYMYSDGALSEIETALTSVVNMGGAILSSHDASIFTAKPLSSVTTLNASPSLQFATETIDFGTSSIKTINTVEVVGAFTASALVEVMVQYRNTRSASYSSTTWKRCSPSGIVSPIVSGVDFRIWCRMSPYTDAVVDSLVIEWQLSDKQSVRGNYTNAASASTNAGR